MTLDHPQLGDFYDELPLWSAPFARLLLDRVPLGRRLRILDLGAGTGFLSIELAQRCGPQSRVIAIDPWVAACERLERKIDYLGLENIEVLNEDAAELDLPPGSMELAVSNLGINNFADPVAVLRRCQQLLCPRGRLLLTTNLVGHMKELYTVLHGVLVDLEIDRVEELRLHILHRGTIESVSTMLETAGFKVGDVVTDSFRLRFASGAALLGHHLIRLGFLPAWQQVVGEARCAEAFQLLEQRLDRLAADEGEISLGIPMALIEAFKPVV